MDDRIFFLQIPNPSSFNMKPFLRVFIVMMMHSYFTYGQFIEQNVINAPVPPTPQASSLLKFVDIPLSYYTGTAEISIPIYELKGKDMNLPISLTFSPNGLKVDEIASWCGFGWSINATGVVSRTIVDIPDEWGHGYFSSTARQYFRPNGSVLNDSCLNLSSDPDVVLGQRLDASNFYTLTNRGLGLGASGENSIDTEPDVYNFSTPTGVSGKFVMDLDQNVRMIPKKPVRVDMFGGLGGNPAEKQFTILDENGIQYDYTSAHERVSAVTVCSNLSGTGRYGVDPISSWYITRMKSEKSGEQISFGYDEENTSYTSTPSSTQSFIVNAAGGSDHSATLDAICNSQYNVSGVRLSSLHLNDIAVHFIADTSARLDLEGGHRLKRIRITGQGQILKEFELYHSYDGYLRLDSIVEFGVNGARLPAYKFHYNDIEFTRGSFAQDHWGYYNGAYDNYTLLPYYKEPFFQINYWNGADRETNTTALQQGALHTIVYPTGGRTVYEYEANTVSSPWIDFYTRSVHSNATSYSNGTAYVDEEEFTLTEETYVEIVSVESWLGPTGEILANCGVEIVGVGNPYYQAVLDNTDRLFFKIPAGDYKLRALMPVLSSPVSDVFASIRWEKLTDSVYNKPVGGLRIKSIEKYDGVSEDPVLTRHLDYNDSLGRSNGKLFAVNYYWYDMTFSDAYMCGPTFCCNLGHDITYRILKSSSLIQPAWVQGSSTGYGQVTEFVDQEVAGKTVYTYYNQSSSFTLNIYPQVQNTAHTYKQSILLKKEEYNAVNVKVRETRNYPKFGALEESHKVYGFQLVDAVIMGCSSCNFIFSDYFHLSEPMATDSVVEISYENQVPFKQLTTNTYSLDTTYLPGDSFYQLRTTKKKDSNNRSWITEYKYPHDYRTENAEMAKLYANNTFVPVMQILKNEANDVLDARIIQYDDYKPIKYFDLEITSPASYATISAITDFDNPGNNFVEKASFTYSSDALISVTKNNNLSQAFIWDDDDYQYLLAETVNATPDQVYFNNFEKSTGTTAGNAHTGKRYLNSGSFNFSSNGFSPSVTANLLMSYWYWSGSAWVFSGELPFSNTFSQGSRLDDIRVYPIGSQMTTYTYEPGVGMTSATDANNHVLYYQYDDMKRLRYIQDKDGNIVKKVEYQYATGN